MAQRQGIARLDRRVSARLQRIASLHATRRDDVATLAVEVAEQRDMSATIRIVFNALNLGGVAILVALEVDKTIVLILTASLLYVGKRGLLGKSVSVREEHVGILTI